MRDAGRSKLRRHDPDVVGQRAGDLLDDLQSWRMNAIVVGAENSHPSKCLLVRNRPAFAFRRRLNRLSPPRQTGPFLRFFASSRHATGARTGPGRRLSSKAPAIAALTAPQARAAGSQLPAAPLHTRLQWERP